MTIKKTKDLRSRILPIVNENEKNIGSTLENNSEETDHLIQRLVITILYLWLIKDQPDASKASSSTLFHKSPQKSDSEFRFDNFRAFATQEEE